MIMMKSCDSVCVFASRFCSVSFRQTEVYSLHIQKTKSKSVYGIGCSQRLFRDTTTLEKFNECDSLCNIPHSSTLLWNIRRSLCEASECSHHCSSILEFLLRLHRWPGVTDV